MKVSIWNGTSSVYVDTAHSLCWINQTRRTFLLDNQTTRDQWYLTSWYLSSQLFTVRCPANASMASGLSVLENTLREKLSSPRKTLKFHTLLYRLRFLRRRLCLTRSLSITTQSKLETYTRPGTRSQERLAMGRDDCLGDREDRLSSLWGQCSNGYQRNARQHGSCSRTHGCSSVSVNICPCLQEGKTRRTERQTSHHAIEDLNLRPTQKQSCNI